MTRHGAGSGLEETRRRLERWRAQHGGPGRPVPEQLWAEAIEAARVAGVEATARTLRLDARRLARRMRVEDEAPVAEEREAKPTSRAFVEMAGSALCLAGGAVLSFEGRDGERLRVELSGAPTVDVVALAHAFWSRGR